MDQVTAVHPVQAKPATNATPQFADEDDNCYAGNQTVRYILEENSGAGCDKSSFTVKMAQPLLDLRGNPVDCSNVTTT